MKLYLFGGAETDKEEAPILKKLINDVLLEIKPKQLLKPVNIIQLSINTGMPITL